MRRAVCFTLVVNFGESSGSFATVCTAIGTALPLTRRLFTSPMSPPTAARSNSACKFTTADAGPLGLGLDRMAAVMQDAGHDRAAGEMAHEMRLVHRHVLDADAGLVALRLDDSVDKQKGVTMRQ